MIGPAALIWLLTAGEHSYGNFPTKPMCENGRQTIAVSPKNLFGVVVPMDKTSCQSKPNPAYKGHP